MTDKTPTHIERPDQPDAPSAIDLLYKAFVERPESAVVGATVARALKATIRGPEARGAVVTGGSGAGKSALLDRIIGSRQTLGEPPRSTKPPRSLTISPNPT